MFVGCLGLLMLAAGFATEIPPALAAKLASTNEVRGVFEMRKTEARQTWTTRGTYRIRPGVDFTWRTLDPFETTFFATPTNYVYSNEDESVARALADLPGADRFAALGAGRTEVFFKAFDALYKEEGGRFFVKARPKVADLARVLRQVEAEGTVSNWTLRATFPTGVTLDVKFTDR